MSYETGVLIALLAWLWLTAISLINLNSRMQRNLRKIGMRLSWLSMAPKPMTGEELNQSVAKKLIKFVFVYGIGLPLVLTSWFYVVYVFAVLIYRKSKDVGAPQTVREFRWKLRNTDMSFNQIVRELIKVGELDSSEFDRVKEELIIEMNARGLTPSH